MWSVDNKTAYAAGQGWIRDRDGAEVWIVAVKASYDILPDGGTRVALYQPPVLSAPVPNEGLQSLRYESDIGPRKPATDVLLLGHAHAPDGIPVEELAIGWRVGPITRTARVLGDRSGKRGLLGLREEFPQPFIRMPLTWERASFDALANPVGCSAELDSQTERRLPNIESVAGGAHGQRVQPPVGFGPIASHWEPRRGFSGTYDEAWMSSRRPLLPLDLDPLHWQVAPAEQQVAGYLRGGEPVSLLHLTPAGFAAHGRIGFTLPRITLAFETRFYDGSIESSRSVIHSVILEPDELRVSVVHHMCLPCHPKVNLLDRTTVREKNRPLDRLLEPSEADWIGSTAAAAP